MRLANFLSLLALVLPVLLSHAAVINDVYHVDCAPLRQQFCDVFKYLCTDEGNFDGYPVDVNQCSGPYDHSFHLKCEEALDSSTKSDVTHYVFNLANSVPNYHPGPIYNVPLTNYAGEGYCVTFLRFCSGFCHAPVSQCKESPGGGAGSATVVVAQCTCGSVDYTGFLNNHTQSIVTSSE